MCHESNGTVLSYALAALEILLSDFPQKTLPFFTKDHITVLVSVCDNSNLNVSKCTLRLLIHLIHVSSSSLLSIQSSFIQLAAEKEVFLFISFFFFVLFLFLSIFSLYFFSLFFLFYFSFLLLFIFSLYFKLKFFLFFFIILFISL
jgi:hypothetical protein